MFNVINDWKQQIAIAWMIKQAMMELDVNHIYAYHLPEIAASPAELQEAENALGFCLNAGYKAFLQCANGWKRFLQNTDLFGTHDLASGPGHDVGQFNLGMLPDSVLKESGVLRNDLLPIAASNRDRDLCVMLGPNSSAPGTVIWFGGEEIDRFPSFDDYFLAMLEYNRIELQRFKDEQKP